MFYLGQRSFFSSYKILHITILISDTEESDWTADFIRPWHSEHAGAVFSRMLSVSDESWIVWVWRCGFQQEKAGLLPPGTAAGAHASSCTCSSLFSYSYILFSFLLFSCFLKFVLMTYLSCALSKHASRESYLKLALLGLFFTFSYTTNPHCLHHLGCCLHPPSANQATTWPHSLPPDSRLSQWSLGTLIRWHWTRHFLHICIYTISYSLSVYLLLITII